MALQTLQQPPVWATLPPDLPGLDPSQQPGVSQRPSVFDPVLSQPPSTDLKPLGMAVPHGGVPQVFAAPPEAPDAQRMPTPIETQVDETSGRLQKLQHEDADPYGSPDNHPGFGGKLLHVLGRIGNIAGDIVAPSVMTQIPGTLANREASENNLTQRLQSLSDEDASEKQKAALTAYETQRPAIETARNTLRGDIAGDKNDTNLAKAGLKKDDDGSIVADPTSPAYQAMQVHEDVQNAQAQLDEATEEVRRASIDPTSPAYQLAVSKANTARVNAGAAVQRAQAYYGNYLMHSKNLDLQGNVLPGAPQIEDNAGNVTTVGSTNAPQAVKAQSNVAQFNDVHGALDNLESAATDLVHSGGSLNSPAIIYAFTHQGTTPTQFIQSLDKANLSPQERAYVIAVQGAHENVQALRKAAGGTATDSSVAKLDELIPNGTTPDLNYLLKQTGQIRQTAERLSKGVTTVKGGEGVRGGHANQGPQALTDGGVTYHIPQDQVAAFKKDHPNAR